MTVVVLDASAAVEALLENDSGQVVRQRLAGHEVHAPYLIELEVTEALRRAVRAGRLSSDRGLDALDDFADLAIVPYPLGALHGRVWELGANLTSYDAVYVALAEALEAPLVTCDARLARAPGIEAAVEVFASGD
ncbi:MAG TPA: type II toxin-antitoxin system VapC family toxin [Gaiella sp.]|nr:type II toxin-antitoxin system VapC family toxin [Gaiella sp.]